MKKNLFFSTTFTLLFLVSFAQNEQCGTIKNLQTQLKKDPSLKQTMESIELQTQEIIKKRKTHQINFSPAIENNSKSDNKTQGIQSLCGYNNTSFTTIAAPTILNQIVSPSPNCTYGGEYVTVNGLTEGRTYRISLCGANNFDTQLTIYPQGGGNAVAHNDDWCAPQSEIYFTPMASGNYDLLVDAYNCTSNTLCANMAVELWNIPRPKITIPVVVHIVHFGEAIGSGRNLSVAQINSQIAVLNSDFRRMNADINSVPAAFRGCSADPLIEFCLAKQDELGNPTTGITRHLGYKASWDINQIEASVKPPTIWDRNKYLNLWTLEFGGADAGTLGFAQFPGGAANTDGVVIQYNSFGNSGNLNPPFDLGRTATHEVGHWFNLRHIWGDESACSQDDLVSDTPLQGNESGGVPTYPLLDACQVIYPGVMFYNYMDYSDDIVTSMFTYGQWARMDAVLFGSRISLQSSQVCISTIGIKENVLNTLFSITPNPSYGIFNLKSDLSIVNNSFRVTITNLLGQNILELSSNDINQNGLEINLNAFGNGVYLAKITYDNQAVTKKLILNK